MTLLEMKKQVLKLIEEYDEKNETNFTGDPDFALKINDVINQIMYELSRIKKIPAYKDIDINIDEKDLYTFKDIDKVNDIYQLDMVRGIDYELKANGTIIKVLENGTLEIEYYKYPIKITKETKDDYVFELSNDVLEIMPYGVAGDLLKSDVSNAYGNVYSQRYEQMKQELDTRYKTMYIEIGDGI